MATTRDVLLTIGQSNADLLGSDEQWRLKHPHLDLIRAPNYGVGSGVPTITLPGRWPGYSGPIPVKGNAVKSLRYFTAYNPRPVAHFGAYPGRLRIGGTASATQFNAVPFIGAVNAAVGVVLTRRRTGTQHVIEANDSLSLVTVSPALDPFPEDGEEFDYHTRCTAAVASFTTVNADLNTTTNRVSRTAHGLGNGFSFTVTSTGAFPSTYPENAFTAGARLYVVDAQTDSFRVSTTFGGPPVDFTALPSGTPTLTWDTTKLQLAQSTAHYDIPTGATGRLNGVVMKCTRATTASAANLNQKRVVAAVGGAFGTVIAFDTAWPAAPQAGDSFSFEAPAPSPDGTFEKLGLWLPWCPFEGRTNQKSFTTTDANLGHFTTVDADINVGASTFTETAHGLTEGQMLNLVSSGAYPGTTPAGQLVAGVRVYVRNPTTDTFQVSLTVTGAVVVLASNTGGATLTWSKSIITSASHGLIENQRLRCTSSLGSSAFGTTFPLTSPANSLASHVHDLYAVNVTSSTFQIASSEDGDPIAILAPLGGGATLTWTYGHVNPFPPGFDYYTDLSLPLPYNALTAYPPLLSHGSAYHTGVAARLREFFADNEAWVISVAVGAACLEPNEVWTDNGSLGSQYALTGWMTSAMKHWSPSTKSGLFQRTLDVLDAAKSAAAAEGITLRVRLISCLQGETDATEEEWAAHYGDNLHNFKAALRQAIKDRGMWDGDAERIPWVQPLITTDAAPNRPANDTLWTYADVVNAAIEAEVDADPWMETCETNDLTKSDYAHYDGDGQTVIEGRIIDAFVRISRLDNTPSALSICNEALGHLGDAARVTSIDPPDGSTQAAQCARYYPIALAMLLEAHAWSFSSRRVALTDVSTDDYTVPTEWAFAYVYPEDAKHVIAVHNPEATGDYTVSSAAPLPGFSASTPQPYTLEVDTRGRRILLTNVEDAVLRYGIAARPERFTDQFRVALTYRLAVLLAPAMVKGEDGVRLSALLERMAETALVRARGVDAVQQKADVRHVPDSISKRG